MNWKNRLQGFFVGRIVYNYESPYEILQIDWTEKTVKVKNLNHDTTLSGMHAMDTFSFTQDKNTGGPEERQFMEEGP